MKRIATFIFAALLALAAAAQDSIVWENPVYDSFSATNGQLSIKRVVISDKKTEVHARVRGRVLGDGFHFLFKEPKLVLPNGKVCNMHAFSSSEIRLDSIIRIKYNEEKEIVYTFGPLPRDTKWFDFIGGKNGEESGFGYDNFNLFYVHDKSQPINHEKPGKEWTKTDYSKLDDYDALMRKVEKAGKPLKPATVDLTLLNYREPMCNDNEVLALLFGEQSAMQTSKINLRDHRTFITFGINEPTFLKLIIGGINGGVNCIIFPGVTTKILVDMVPAEGNSVYCEFIGPMAATNRHLTKVKTYRDFSKNVNTRKPYPEYGEFLGQSIASLPTIKKRGFAKMSNEEFERMFVRDNDLSKMPKAKRNQYLKMYALDVARHWDREFLSRTDYNDFIPTIDRNIDDNGRAYYRVRIPHWGWGRNAEHIQNAGFAFNANTNEYDVSKLQLHEAAHVDFWENTGQPFNVDTDLNYVEKKLRRYFSDEMPYQALRGKDIIRDRPIPADAFSVISDSVELSFQPIDDTSAALVASFGERYKGDIIVPQTVNSNGKTYRVSTIAKNAFSECKNLNTVSLPTSVTTIADSAFCNCNKLSEINLTHVESIGNSAFGKCQSLKEVDFSPQLRELGERAFYECHMLSRIDLKGEIMEIKKETFRGCGGKADSLTVTLPKTLKIIGPSAFQYCYNMTSIDMPEGLVSIEESAFGQCTKLSNVKIPSTVEKIGSRCFISCRALTDVILPKKLREVEDAAFDDTSIKHVAIPASVKRIGILAFANTPLENIELEEGLEDINEYAFMDTPNLKSITLPASLKRLGCIFDEETQHPIVITSLATTPPSRRNANNPPPANVSTDNSTLYVPASALEAYKTAPGWKDFKNILPIE